ncbi:DUF927 domain-containing protein [Ferrovum sp.]|jgi:uncharacterized protein (DUF927 family)/phage/plasmid primase-like uncharacterized protein|uniref:DUF927 domain-containing protein n=1 Tax=Ferrovum sp. TaxID=2609467 RepID=UPI00260563B0|nr:DUF927 domain-containing protein [Ferrovum sp.]
MTQINKFVSNKGCISNLIDAITESGIKPPESVIFDGKLHRFSSSGKKGDDAGWYILFDGAIPGGCFGCWRSGFKQNWHATIDRVLTQSEKAEFKTSLKAAQEIRKAEETERHAKAAEKAVTIWNSASSASDDHPYLAKKGVAAHGARLHQESLVLSLRNISDVIHSLQFITPNGEKRFLPDGRVLGCHFLIGAVAMASKIAICEGFATGATIHQATGFPVVVAFTASNLPGVAKSFREKFPDLQIIICSDDDHHREGNPGLTKATLAAASVDAFLAVPNFGSSRQKGDTDFNDMHRLHGLEAVKLAINMATLVPAASSSHDAQGQDSSEKKTFSFEFGGGRFVVSNSGVAFIGQPDESGAEPLPKWICSKITVEALTRDDSSGEWGRLLHWKDSDRVRHEWSMPMELLQGDGADVRRELARLGVTIAPGKTARDLLTSFLQTYPVETRARCVDRLGWHGTGVYVTPTEAIGQSSETVVFQNAHAIEPAFSSNGTLDDWCNSVATLARGNSRLLFAASVAFAAPLLGLIDEDSGGFNLKGGSSSGKSTILKVTSSVWGSPNTYPRLWRATANGLEGLAALHNDGLLILDELGQIDPKEAGEVAYMLANGQGKTRASRNGTARPSASWRILFLSAGEVGIASLMATAGKRTNAGQEIRLADIPADAGVAMGAFEDIHGHPSPAAFALALKEAAIRAHGATGLQWLRHVVQDRANLAEILSKGIMDFVSEVAPTDSEGQVIRVARRFGIVAVAGELASHYQLTGWSEGEAAQGVKKCFAAWLEGFGSKGNREERAILDHVKRFFESHGSARFENSDAHEEQRIINRAGFMHTNPNGCREYFVLPEAFKNELCLGFDQKLVIDVLKVHKWLEPGSDGRPTQKPRIAGFGTPRVYVFNSRLWETE